MRKAILAAVLLAFGADVASADGPPPLPAKRKAHKPHKAKRVHVAPRRHVPPPHAAVPMPVPVVPIRALHNWTGGYAGGNFGGGWAFTNSNFSAGGTSFAIARNPLEGLNGGFQFGYNWQADRNVFGFETDIQYSSQDGSLDAPLCPTPICAVATSASYSQKMPWFGTVRGRIGHATETWMAYVTAGYAYARLNTEATASAGGTTVTAGQGGSRSGWTAGGGLEVALAPRWSVKLEYLYMDFGSRDVTWAFTGLPSITDSIKFRQNIVRSGLNYRF